MNMRIADRDLDMLLYIISDWSKKADWTSAKNAGLDDDLDDLYNYLLSEKNERKHPELNMF